MCACGPDSRRYLISWLPRAQLSLSKELFQLESPPPTLALAKYTSLSAVLHETRHIRLFRIDRPTRIDQPDRVSHLVRCTRDPAIKKKEKKRKKRKKTYQSFFSSIQYVRFVELIKVKNNKINKCGLQVATYREKLIRAKYTRLIYRGKDETTG